MLDGIEVTKAGTPDQDADVFTVNFYLKKLNLASTEILLPRECITGSKILMMITNLY